MILFWAILSLCDAVGIGIGYATFSAVLRENQLDKEPLFSIWASQQHQRIYEGVFYLTVATAKRWLFCAWLKSGSVLTVLQLLLCSGGLLIIRLLVGEAQARCSWSVITNWLMNLPSWCYWEMELKLRIYCLIGDLNLDSNNSFFIYMYIAVWPRYINLVPLKIQMRQFLDNFKTLCCLLSSPNALIFIHLRLFCVIHLMTQPSNLESSGCSVLNNIFRCRF